MLDFPFPPYLTDTSFILLWLCKCLTLLICSLECSLAPRHLSPEGPKRFKPSMDLSFLPTFFSSWSSLMCSGNCEKQSTYFLTSQKTQHYLELRKSKAGGWTNLPKVTQIQKLNPHLTPKSQNLTWTHFTGPAALTTWGQVVISL